MTDSTLLKRAKKLPPPNYGVVTVPLELLPAYFILWNIKPVAGGWQYDSRARDYALQIQKVDPAEKP